MCRDNLLKQSSLRGRPDPLFPQGAFASSRASKNQDDTAKRAHSQNRRAGKIQAHSHSKLLTQTTIQASWEGRGPVPIPLGKFQNNSFHLEFKVNPQPGLQAGQQVVKESKGQDKVHRRSKNVSKKHSPQRDTQENTRSSPEPIQELQVDQSQAIEPQGFTQRARPESPQEVKQNQ
jgi:hypothetical protein